MTYDTDHAISELVAVGREHTMRANDSATPESTNGSATTASTRASTSWASS